MVVADEVRAELTVLNVNMPTGTVSLFDVHGDYDFDLPSRSALPFGVLLVSHV